MALKKEQKKQLTIAGVLFGLAILFFFLFNRALPEPMEFFYDESEDGLFEAPAGSIPPIRGINDNVVDGVRAILIAPKGKSRDASARRIAYLEKWSSQLKQQLEAAAKAKEAGYAVPNVIDRSARNFHRFVRTVDSPKWHSMNTDQAARIIAVLRTKDSQGKLPEVCTPNYCPGSPHPGFWCQPCNIIDLYRWKLPRLVFPLTSFQARVLSTGSGACYPHWASTGHWS